MYINYARRELTIKVVYYGPALGGKTTNLIQIHDHVADSQRSDLISLKTAEDRTLFFDFMEVKLGKIVGLAPRVQLYTVPGQPRYEASRKLVLRGADGVVFVADSQISRQMENLESWLNMQQHLASYGVALPGFPVIVQLNKRDLPSAVAPHLFRRVLNLNGECPLVEAVAVQGVGVREALKIILERVVTRIKQEIPQPPPAG
jgi:signal recognition particle receptor subunit beta